MKVCHFGEIFAQWRSFSTIQKLFSCDKYIRFHLC
ncbi:unnamed protein product [Brassica napus]|uniref:(rape) hypothetical protein n=1 Tax=Brassica napus TaxID=3708 RepID=A0A816NYV2_BRANA|nr:unnamed protein product [Brassica napus]